MSNVNPKLIVSLVLFTLVYGSLVTLAILYDGLFLQVCIDLGIMTVSAVLGYLYKVSSSKDAV